MSLEIMKGIQQAEAQADEIRQTAQREARDVVKAVEAAIAQHPFTPLSDRFISEAAIFALSPTRTKRGILG